MISTTRLLGLALVLAAACGDGEHDGDVDATGTTAVFDLEDGLVVTAAGTGTGTVTSSPGGIDCGGDCDEAYAPDTEVTLTATAGLDTTFAGWSGGGCSGTSTCVVTIAGVIEVTATFDGPPPPPALVVERDGSGVGTVTSAPAGIDCGDDCEEAYALDTEVTLTAVADDGSTFTGWSGGGCTGTGTCTLTFLEATTVTATFTLEPFTLAVTRAGNGTGTVTSFPPGLDCGSDCTEPLDPGSLVVLIADPAAGSTFAGWSGGGCTGTDPCWLILDDDTTVTATFALITYPLNVTKTGSGGGTVTSSPAGIACGADCTEAYLPGTAVTLTATPATGSQFMGWSGGGCAGTAPCTTTIAAATTVNAQFLVTLHRLRVTRTGSGAATSVVSGSGITCGADCEEYFAYGSTVTLSASVGPGMMFTGWSGGGCSGTGACVVTLAGAPGVHVDVTANFIAPFALNVYFLEDYDGQGTVTSDPWGVDCPGDCAHSYYDGTSVTLTATPAWGSTFDGWADGCAGTATTCTVAMSQARNVAVKFKKNKYWLTVYRSGNGSGSVADGDGIACGTDCTELYPHGTVRTLTATAASGSTFAGWSGGGCAGTATTCTTSVTAATTVTAQFTRPVLTITKFGNGTGTVTSSPGGITCGSDCTEPYNAGTTIVLTAVPATGTQFTGWVGGGCAGTGTCTTTMSTSKSIRAQFYLTIHQLTVTRAGTGTGAVVSSAAGINCGSDCSEYYYYGSSVTLSAIASPGSTFTGWSGGGCTGTAVTCTVPITAGPGVGVPVTATFSSP